MALLLASTCLGQVVDPGKKTITHQIGSTKHTIGDIDQDGDFDAHIKWEIFSGEDTIELQMPGISGNMAVFGTEVEIPWGTNSRIRFVQDGSFLRMKIYLDKKPPFSSYTFQLGGGWREFDYFYQTPFPSPTEFIGPDGDIYLRQDTLPGDPAINHERRKALDGGWVVSHKWKRNNQYRIGFALAILRPKITDAQGKVVFLNVDVDDVAGTVTLSLPQNQWNQLDYPITINDTLGEEDVTGFSDAQLGTDWLIGDLGTTPAFSGTAVADRISSHHRESVPGNPDMVAGLYTDASPNVLVTNGGCTERTISGNTGTWYDFSFGTAPTVTASTNYAYFTHFSDNIRFYYHLTGGSGRGRNKSSVTYTGTAPSSFTSVNYNRRIGIHLDYTVTPAGGGGSRNYGFIIGKATHGLGRNQ